MSVDRRWCQESCPRQWGGDNHTLQEDGGHGADNHRETAISRADRVKNIVAPTAPRDFRWSAIGTRVRTLLVDTREGKFGKFRVDAIGLSYLVGGVGGNISLR